MTTTEHACSPATIRSHIIMGVILVASVLSFASRDKAIAQEVAEGGISSAPAAAESPNDDESTESDGGGSETSTATSKPPAEKARRVYLGRIVAKPMSYHGANWLIRSNRDQEENVRLAYKQLKLTVGMTVCDLGCGNGFWTLPMAKSVGESGKVLAVDIQREMLQLLRQRASKAGVNNIEPVLGKINDPNLPAGQVDLLLMVDVYHEFSHPESMLWGIRRSLKPEGVVALLEYREEDPNVPIKPLHKMSKSQIIKEYEANGMKLVREFNDLPWQHLMFFARDDSPLKKIDPIPGIDTVKKLPKRSR